MLKMASIKTVEDDQLEIKINTLHDVYLAHISSGYIKGTLVFGKNIEKNDLVEVSEAIYDIIAQYNLLHNANGVAN